MISQEEMPQMHDEYVWHSYYRNFYLNQSVIYIESVLINDATISPLHSLPQ